MVKFKETILKLLTSLLLPFRIVLNKVLSIRGFEQLKAALQTPEIQRKIFYTIFIIIVFRVLASIPLPGIDIEVYKSAVNTNTGNALSNLWTIATGGNIDSPTLAVIGLGSYINASIIIQLLTTVVPKLEELQKEGANGRRILSQITRFLTLPLSIMQGFVIYTVIKNNPQPISDGYVLSELVTNMTSREVLVMIAAIAAGSILLMWLSELITENGLGNGSSIVIMIGILATFPGLVIQDFGDKFNWFVDRIREGSFEAIYSDTMVFIYLVIIGFIFLVAVIVFMNEAVRKVSIQYARRVRGTQTAQSSYLPLKLNQAGVMPMIFASSILTFPTIISQFAVGAFDPGSKAYEIAIDIQSYEIFNFRSIWYILLYFALIFMFTFFYTFIVMKPEETAENLQKSGGFIPGIRPGKTTKQFITNTLVRLTFVGAIFLGLVAITPNLVSITEQGQNLLLFTGLGGTSLLIIVGVILDTMRQAKSLTVTRSYELYK